eukprot:7777992-Heterocapsa_arctica.AAC.1
MFCPCVTQEAPLVQLPPDAGLGMARPPVGAPGVPPSNHALTCSRWSGAVAPACWAGWGFGCCHSRRKGTLGLCSTLLSTTMICP